VRSVLAEVLDRIHWITLWSKDQVLRRAPLFGLYCEQDAGTCTPLRM
jgi:hypothetical protein